MNEKAINDLPACPSPSALRVATARAAHQLLEDELLFKDEFAVATLGARQAAALLREPLVHNDVAGRSLRAGIIGRARFAEDRLLSAIAEGTAQNVLVGAGLDTWALRMANLLPAVSTYELDQPRMQQWKQQLYALNGWQPPRQLRYLPMDLRETTAVQALKQGGADLQRPISISVLGVLVYLNEETVARELAALNELAPGSTLVLDYRLDAERLNPMERVMMEFTAQMMTAGGEPWLSSSTPERMVQLLAAAGFAVEEDLGAAELNARYFAGRRDGLQLAGGGFRYLSAIKRV